MPRAALKLSSLIISIVLLISGNAYLMTLLGLRLSIADFSAALIGWILFFYSLGFVAGTLYAGRVIENVGHIRAFAVFSALLAASILLYPMAVDTSLWALLRAVGGFVMAGLMIVMESWFSSSADNQNRARLFAVYQIIFFLATTAGQVLIRVADPAGFMPFSLAAILVSLALIPLSLSRRESPTIERGERLSLAVLYRTTPIGTLGALAAGLLISAFYTMGPVYADRIGLDLNQLSNFMAAAIVGAMILAWPIGRLCDHMDRYRVLFLAAAVAAACSLLAVLLGGWHMPLLVLVVGLYMGISAALYPIAVAISNDLMPAERITAASTALLLSYGIGSCIGPLWSAAFMELFGPRGLFISTAVILAGLILFMKLVRGRRPEAVQAQQQFYTTTAEATLGLAELDPRNPDFQGGTDQAAGHQPQADRDVGNKH